MSFHPILITGFCVHLVHPETHLLQFRIFGQRQRRWDFQTFQGIALAKKLSHKQEQPYKVEPLPVKWDYP